VNSHSQTLARQPTLQHNHARYGSGGDILAETDASGNTTAEYIFFGGKRIAMLPASSTPIYYVEDMLGTSRVIATNTGVVCYDADFYPYGGERSYTNTCPQNYKFEGKERDTETGNDDFGARYYSNRFGRWLSADWSSVPAPVPYANLTNPQTLNLYAMVADDPESFADLDGHETGATAPPTQSNGCTGDPKNCTVHPASEDIDRQQGKPTEPQQQSQASAAAPALAAACTAAPGCQTAVIAVGLLGGPEIGALAVALAYPSEPTGTAMDALTPPYIEAPPLQNQGVSQSQSTGPKAADAPGVTAGGQAANEHGEKLGPSGKPMVHDADMPSKKAAKDAARNAGQGTPVQHPSPRKGKPHFHPSDSDGKKKPGSTHYNYPD
jgi:RHS repeat-associated protein